METLSSVSMERMKVQLLQKQSELTATIQAFEEFKEVNKYVHVTFMCLFPNACGVLGGCKFDDFDQCVNIILFRKQAAELESEKRYLEKSNKHLENILEATKAYSKQELSQLNKIHAETIKVGRL